MYYMYLRLQNVDRQQENFRSPEISRPRAERGGTERSIHSFSQRGREALRAHTGRLRAKTKTRAARRRRAEGRERAAAAAAAALFPPRCAMPKGKETRSRERKKAHTPGAQNHQPFGSLGESALKGCTYRMGFRVDLLSVFWRTEEMGIDDFLASKWEGKKEKKKN